MIILLIPVIIILRRAAIVTLYRKKCGSGRKAAVFAAYKKFGRLVKLMKLPAQGGLDYSEYEKALSDRTSLLSDGTAKVVIDAALKASFGGGQLTDNESREAVFAVNTLAKRYYGTQNRFGKFLLKYFYCIL